MADPHERYSENESLDRILRTLLGESTSEAPESLPPPRRSKAESLSQIAELLAGTLEGEQAVVPTGLNSYGMIFVNAVSSGYALASGTWTYVRLATGTGLQNVTEAHDDTTGHLLTVSKDGDYLIGYNLTLAGTKDVDYEFALYANGSVLDQGYSRLTLRASGTWHSLSGSAIDAQLASEPLGLIVRTATHNANFALRSGQMWIKSL